MNIYKAISSNFPGSSNFEEHAFIGRLHEECVWDCDKYWQLELALFKASNEEISIELQSQIFRIFSIIMMSICSHFDKNDRFIIKNLSLEDVYNFRERVQMVFEGVFQKKMPSNNAFEIINPLL